MGILCPSEIVINVKCWEYFGSLHSYYATTKHEQLMIQAMEESDDATVKRLLSGSVKAFKRELEAQGTLKYLLDGVKAKCQRSH